MPTKGDKNPKEAFHKWLNKIGVPSAAGVLAAAIAPGMALAETAEHPFVLSLDGAVGVGNHSNAYGEAKLGNGFDAFDHNVAFVGSVGLSRAINETWDWSISVSQLGYAENSLSESSNDTIFTLTDQSSRSEADFTFGHELALGSAKARLGLGLAYAKASAEKGLDLSDDLLSGNYLRNDLKTEFQGIGPHVSFDVKSAPLSANSKLSLIGGAEVSVLAGKYQHSKGLDAYLYGNPGNYEATESEDGRLLTAGLKLGLQYDANEKTSFHAGIRHDITRMDLTSADDPIGHVSVNDGRTSFFVGMDVGF